MTPRREVTVPEWGVVAAGTPDGAGLDGIYLDDPDLAGVVAALRRTNAIEVTEGRHGLVLRARQHVGVVQLGPVRVRVRPKLPAEAVWTAVAYGLGLDAALVLPPVDLAVEEGFVDLLARLLLDATDALWRAGLHRAYVAREEWLTAPRGRPDVVAMQRSGPLRRAALPCRHHAFEPDALLHGVLVSGLQLASGAVDDVRLRGALHRATSAWRTVAAPVRLDRATFDALERGRNRLNARYAPAHALVRWLWEGAGVDDELGGGDVALPGHLWDMARLYERFVARFLDEHLTTARVRAQTSLRRLYDVEPGTHGHRAPNPRPDLVAHGPDGVVAVLDTKYLDAWRPPLPQTILYQLSVYALAWSTEAGPDVPAVVLYPSEEPRPDVRYRLNVAGGGTRSIVLRPVDWGRAAGSIRARAGRAERVALAERWVFGGG